MDNSTNSMPQLTLEPFGKQAETPVTEAQAAEAAVQAKTAIEDTLTAEEKQQVEQFAKQIDITNSNMILQYGAGAQQKIAEFSDAALQNVQTKDLGEVGDMITGLVTELKSFDVDSEQKGGLFGFFKKTSNQITALKAKYDKAEVNVEKISGVLENHQIRLLKDIAVLDKLYEQNLNHFKELNMYILAGKLKLEETRSTVLPELIQKAQLSGLPEDSQKANDMASFCDRFEKKLHDLELTRMVSIQMAPQIRLVQNNDTLMSEKIQTTLVNTIPLWKSQMVIALGLSHSQQALEAQRAVSDLTNNLLKKNADALKMGTIETAKEAERGIVDIETLQHTNASLISTLDEVVKIQEDGRAKRRAAEVELGKLETELKQKLLDIRGQ